MSGAYSIACPVYGVPPAAPPRRAGHDAARTTDENRRHWAAADGLAPVAQLTPFVRKTLRDRARYEAANNCYMAGLIRTLVGDTVGTGPRLQMQAPDAALNANVEDLWRTWSRAVRFPLLMRVMAGVRYVAGECFAVFRDSKRLTRLGLPVTLDVRLIEPDQVTDGIAGQLFNATGDDGIVCDEEGEVEAYKILRFHPGGNRLPSAPLKPDAVPAENVVHWFQPERPGQLRGYPPVSPALDIFAQLRRFSKATLTAAEVAALLAGVLELPDSQPATGQAPTYETMDTIELVRGMLLTVPAGAKATQFKPEQPTATHEQYVNVKLREAGRSLNVPFGKMAGDHSRYNYSSGRLDDGNYWSDRAVERQEFEVEAFDPILHKFFDFARFVIPGLVRYEGKWWQLAHCWHYDARLSIDPVKDATGDELNLTNGSDTLAAIAARDGTTVEAILDQRRREKEMFEERQLPLPPWLAGTPAPPRQPADGPQSNPQEAAPNAA